MPFHETPGIHEKTHCPAFISRNPLLFSPSPQIIIIFVFFIRLIRLIFIIFVFFLFTTHFHRAILFQGGDHMSADGRNTRDETVVRFNLEHFGKIIRMHRRNLGLTQEETAQLLHIGKNHVSNWERGWSRPDLALVPRLCEVLHISLETFFSLPEPGPLISAQENRLLDVYRSLTAHDRKCVESLAAQLAGQEKEEFEQSCRRRFLRCSRSPQSAAAGVSVPLDDLAPESVFIRKTKISMEADEIVPINGDSMEPVYQDGDEVYVQHVSFLNRGDIGLFIVNGEGFIKQWLGNRLHSLNPAREDIPLLDSDDIRLVGRVLGRVAPEDWPSEAENRVLTALDSD